MTLQSNVGTGRTNPMARYALAALIGCLYVALSAWIVQGEGKRYRDSLRVSAPVATPAVRPGNVEVPAPPVPAPPEEEKADIADPAAPPAPASTPPSPPSSIAEDPPRSIVMRPESLVVREPDFEPPIVDAAWANSLNLSSLTPDEEERLGRELHRLVLKFAREAKVPRWDIPRVSKLARNVNGKEYTVTILDSDAVNAFSHPGGHIYLCRGLFDLIGSDEDYALTFVLGHEIAHLELKHGLKSVTRGGANERAKGRGIDTLNQFLLPIAAGHPEDHEYEADRWIYRRMRGTLDYTQRETLAFLRKFVGYSEIHNFSNGREPSEEVTSFIDSQFRMHPAAWRRLERLLELSRPPAAATPR